LDRLPFVLFGLTLLRARVQVPRGFFWRGVAAGVSAHLVVTLVAGALAWT
jgi:hypothetical protein